MSTADQTQGSSEADYFVRLQPGEYVFREGDAGTTMFIIEDGVVDLIKESDGSEHVLASLEQGDFFGEMSILEDQPRSASARASTECQLLRIDKAMFDQMLRQNPEIAVRMLRKLSRRLRQVTGGRSFDSAHEAAPPAAAAAPPPDVAAAAAPEPPPAPAAEATTPPPAAPSVEQPSAVGPRVFRLIDAGTGVEIVMPEATEITVGRPDPVTGQVPDIDLSSYDTVRSVSRRHAKIFRTGDDFFVCEEVGTANGTFVNAERVKTGVRVPINDGDQVSFGRVAMTFRSV